MTITDKRIKKMHEHLDSNWNEFEMNEKKATNKKNQR